MLIVLIRHGETHTHIRGRIQRRSDEISEVGWEQARRVAEALVVRGGADVLYTSPLRRAMQTSQIISQELNLTPIVLEGLAEIDAGTAEGQDWSQWRQAHPDVVDAMADPLLGMKKGWPDGENGDQFSRRVLRAFSYVCARHSDTEQTVILVAHGGSLAWIWAAAHGDDLDQWPASRGGFRNCAISEIWVSRNHELVPGAWNEGSHLTDRIPRSDEIE